MSPSVPVNLDRAEARRYLALLGIRESEPGVELLTSIVRAHVTRIPFENISKLYRWKTAGFQGLTDIGMFLDGIEEHHFGGTCYSNNYHLHQLLRYLGFDADLCGADMSRPDLHVVNIVRVAGREYLVDAGYAAPFLAQLPRDLATNHVVALGTDRYVLAPKDAAGRSRMTLWRNGVSHHGYLVNPVPRDIGHFAETIAESFRPDARLLVIRSTFEIK